MLRKESTTTWNTVRENEKSATTHERKSMRYLHSWTFDAEAVALLNALPGPRVGHSALVHAGIGLADVVEAV